MKKGDRFKLTARFGTYWNEGDIIVVTDPPIRGSLFNCFNETSRQNGRWCFNNDEFEKIEQELYLPEWF